MSLPCKHIFRLRMDSGVKLFDESLILNRWKLDYFIKHQDRSEAAEAHEETVSVISNRECSQPLSQHAKYRKAFLVAQRMASLVSESTGVLFDNLMHKMLEFEATLKSAVNEAANEVHLDRPSLGIGSSAVNKPILSTESGEDIAINKILQSSLVSAEVHNDQPSLGNGSSDVNELLLSTESGEDIAINKILQSSLVSTEVHNDQPSLGNGSSDVNELLLSTESGEDIDNISVEVHMDHPPSVSVKEAMLLSTEGGGAIDINTIKMPAWILRRGRPKGAETTVIGLPKKKKRLTPKLLPFSKLSPSEKDKMLLGWLVKSSVLYAIVNYERLVEIADIIPWLQIPTKVTEEPVEVSRVRRYFSASAWSDLTTRIDLIKQRNLWLCQACDNELCGTFVIKCDHCLNLFDRKCVGLKSEPKSKLWFCKSCLL